MKLQTILSIRVFFYSMLALLITACSPRLYEVPAAHNYAAELKTDSLKSYIAFLASDSLKGRLTCDEGQKSAAKFLSMKLERYGLLPLTRDRFNRPRYMQQFTVENHPMKASFPDMSLYAENVAGYVEGVNTNEWLVISAHYDHLGSKGKTVMYGADDNGTGTSAVLEMARVFAKAAREGQKPQRNVVFLFFSGEEIGLLGSEYFVQHPPMPLQQVVADLNIDMIGRFDSAHLNDRKYIYVIGSDKLSSELDIISKQVNDHCCKMELDYTYNDEKDPLRLYYRSDHYNFAKHDVPVIFYFSGLHEDYHKPTDTPDRILLDVLSDRTQLIFYTAWELAFREKRPELDKHRK